MSANLPSGKGWFIWKILDCEGGNPDEIAKLAEYACLGHVLIKIADGTRPINVENGLDLAKPVIRALRSRIPGLQVWGWHYVYGYLPIDEADVAIQRCQELGLDGYVVDAEAEYKEPGKVAAAQKFMFRVRNGLPGLPIGLSSYRYPAYHPQLPWKEFLALCDFNMPQVYWEGRHDPAQQLEASIGQFKKVAPWRPIVPTGSAYRRGSWATTTADVEAFLKAASRLDLPGANFWEWGHTRRNLPDLWETVATFDYSVGKPTPTPTARPLEVLVKVDGLRLRSTPQARSDLSNVIGHLQVGAVETVLSIEGPQEVWVYVKETANHPAGWAAMRYQGQRLMEVV